MMTVLTTRADDKTAPQYVVNEMISCAIAPLRSKRATVIGTKNIWLRVTAPEKIEHRRARIDFRAASNDGRMENPDDTGNPDGGRSRT
jgi:hypothetical protein